MKTNESTDTNPIFEGYCIDLMDELKTLMGFEYKIEYRDDNYGKMDANGEWSGMIRMLMDKVSFYSYYNPKLLSPFLGSRCCTWSTFSNGREGKCSRFYCPLL